MKNTKTGYLSPAMVASKDQAWQTPDDVLDVVRQVAHIELDPCTSPDNPVGADTYYALENDNDGLINPWQLTERHHQVYVNPPFKNATPFIEQAAHTGSRGAQVTMLLPARVDTKNWRLATSSCQAFAFWNRRIKFRGAKDAAPFPVAFFYWGPNRWGFSRAFRPHAQVHIQGIGWA